MRYFVPSRAEYPSGEKVERNEEITDALIRPSPAVGRRQQVPRCRVVLVHSCRAQRRQLLEILCRKTFHASQHAPCRPTEDATVALSAGQKTLLEAFVVSVRLHGIRNQVIDHCIEIGGEFCEAILVRQGKADEAYRRFGLPTAGGNTWLAMWRDLMKRYPDRDARALLDDLIALHGCKGKWFAAAKTAGYLDIALECAADVEAAPATLIRAARDFAVKNPAFAAQVALHAIIHLLAGRGYDASPIDIDSAVDHLMAASRRMDRTAWAFAELRRLANLEGQTDLMTQRLRLKLKMIEDEYDRA